MVGGDGARGVGMGCVWWVERDIPPRTHSAASEPARSSEPTPHYDKVKEGRREVEREGGKEKKNTNSKLP